MVLFVGRYDETLKIDGESILNPLWHCLWLDEVGKWSSLLVSYGQIRLATQNVSGHARLAQHGV